MGLLFSMDLKPYEIIAFVGGGGKTTLMFRLADEIPPRYPTLITTTTKVHIPLADRYPIFVDAEKRFDADELHRLAQTGIKPVLGSKTISGNKLKGVTLEQFNHIASWAGISYILVEADGSNGRSLKGHLCFEPVIPPSTTLLVIVIGADALGKSLDSYYIHRPQVATELTGSKPEAVITPKIIASLIKHPQGIMRACPPGARIIAMINKVDCLTSLDEAYHTAHLLVGDKVDQVTLCSAISEKPIIDIVT